MKSKVANGEALGMDDDEQMRVFTEVTDLAQQVEGLFIGRNPSVVMSALAMLMAHGIRTAGDPIGTFSQTVTALHVNLMADADRKGMH